MWPFGGRKYVRREPVAVLIVDMQSGFLENHTEEAQQNLISAQVKIISECAEQDVPVIVLEFDADHYGPTVPQIMNELKHVPRVSRLGKTWDDGFTNPDLHEALKALGIEKLVLMGINASYCVRATAKSAVRKGYRIFTADDLISDASHIPAGKSESWYQVNGTFFSGTLTLENVLG